jgi:hypothetical protein
MGALLIFLIVVLSGVICALAGFWFYRATQEHKQNIGPPQIARRPIRNDAWDRAVRAARNRNW